MTARTKQRVWNVTEAVLVATIIGGLASIVTGHFQGIEHTRRIDGLEAKSSIIDEIRERLARIEGKLDNLKP